MKVKYAILPLFFLFFSFESAYCEVEKVVVTWKPGYCSPNCLVQLRQRLGSIPNVAEIKFEAGQNQAALRWAPNQSFSWEIINVTMRSVGVSLHQTFATVRGTIGHSGDAFYIQSLGDNTRFLLVSPLNIISTGAASINSLETSKLSPEARDLLLTAELARQIVTIEGPLFEPWRSNPLYLTAQRVAIPPKW